MSADPEYDRILAELTPDQRLRLLDKDFDLQRELSKKSKRRRWLAGLSPAEKLHLLEELRNRAQLQQGSRRSEAKTQPVSEASASPSTRFGGRATATGVGYEVNVAAYIAVKMLGGSQCVAWDCVTGADLAAVGMQAPEPVDDVVVNLRTDAEARVFISAKERSRPIALTSKSPAFRDTVTAFVRQFLALSATARPKSRLVWAVPSRVGPAAAHDLPEALANHRGTGGGSLSEFLNGRSAKERKALDAFLSLASQEWERKSGTPPTDDEMRSFLAQVYVQVYDFGTDGGQQREAEENIRAHIVANPELAQRGWQTIRGVFTDANQNGTRITPSILREALIKSGITLKSPPDYAEEISRLNELTTRNQARLGQHAVLRFGPQDSDVIHIPRTEELSSLLMSADSKHLLITGEPGCGKSGLIHDFVEELQKNGTAVVLLLAEDVFGRDWKGSANIPDFTHALDEVLANWPGTPGVLVTDALDAVRDIDTQKLLRCLLGDVQEGKSGWTVIASVREFDLKYGRELRAQFSGAGVEGHASKDFAGVAHFHLGGLSDAQLVDLAAHRANIKPFLERARDNPKAGGVHRSPFYLQLAAELLSDGIEPSRLADWASPAVLLRKFWDARIKGGTGLNDRTAALREICQKMVEARSMMVSSKELQFHASESAINDLRSRGILQAPALRYGTNVGSDEVRFSHHLLHDYAVARTLIPELPERFCDFVRNDSLLPILYRQSFLFALEEIWDASEERTGFWQCVLWLENVPELHGVTRILGPVLAARRVECLADLQPLLMAVQSSADANAPSQKALRHLASGLQDANEDAIRAGASGWCAFAEQLGSSLQSNGSLEQPLTLIIAHLTAVGAAASLVDKRSLNAAARGLLACHVAKDVSRGWRYASQVATETLCRTFTVAPVETERALLGLFTPERLSKFPHHDLFDLSHSIKHLGPEGDGVVLRLFEAAFGAEPVDNEMEPSGSLILSLQFQTKDSWNIIRYSLAEYYGARTNEDAAFMTEAVCVAWNSAARRRAGSRGKEEPLATISFRGFSCGLLEDYSHVWGREFEHDENRMLSHFEKLLRKWASENDQGSLNQALNRFAVRNRASLMWNVFMEIGAEYATTLGVMLEGVLSESLFLTHPDYVYGGTALLGGLHRAGDVLLRERMEKLILDLPRTIRLRKEASPEQAAKAVERAQNRLLGVLEEPNIVLEDVRNLWKVRNAAGALTSNPRPKAPEATWATPPQTANTGAADPVTDRMLRLRKSLAPLLGRDNKRVSDEEFERLWPLVEESDSVLQELGNGNASIAQELWGYLVGVCENIARHAAWAKADNRWQVIRRILLRAASDPIPEARDYDPGERDDWPSWGWPSPRVDAAQGLPLVALHLNVADAEVMAALRKLSEDNSHPVRFNLAFRVGVLGELDTAFMWELVDKTIATERSFAVLDGLLRSIDVMWWRAPNDMVARVQRIAERSRAASPENGIHETLAFTTLFQFLRTGQPECESYVDGLIEDCDSERASRALLTQLHSLRIGGWLTAGDGVHTDQRADTIRERTWSFLSKLMDSAQRKLLQRRNQLRQFQEARQSETDAVKACQESITRAFRVVDGIATQLYFASGAHTERANMPGERLSAPQTRRFWQEAKPIFTKLAQEPHPHTAYQFVQTLCYLLPYEPREAFLLATRSILRSAEAGIQYESLAVGEVVRLIQCALADHRDIFRREGTQESECLVALLRVLDLFVEAGWSEARRLTHRLEEIYR